MDVLDGTSLRVSFQNIARRYASAGKSMDEIAEAQLKFRPGKRTVAVSTPASRARNTAGRAAEKVAPEVLTRFMERVISGDITEAEIEAYSNKQ